MRDPEPLARVLLRWLYAYAAGAAVSLLAGLYMLSQLAGLEGRLVVNWEEPTLGLETAETVTLLADGPYLIAGIGAAFLTLKWIYRTNRNAHTFADGLPISPAWGLGWFFVPVALLWKPFQGVRQTWQASVDPDQWREVPVPTLLRWWWGLWLLTVVVDSASTRLAFAYENIDQLTQLTAMEAVSALINIPLTFVLIAVVRRLTELQARQLAVQQMS